MTLRIRKKKKIFARKKQYFGNMEKNNFVQVVIKKEKGNSLVSKTEFLKIALEERIGKFQI